MEAVRARAAVLKAKRELGVMGVRMRGALQGQTCCALGDSAELTWQNSAPRPKPALQHVTFDHRQKAQRAREGCPADAHFGGSS